MRDRRRVDDSRSLQLQLVRLDAFEQPHSRSEQDRREVDLELLEQAGVEELRHSLGASGDLDILLAGG
jgi:hypothetical protein